jgi:hypothetical protein
LSCKAFWSFIGNASWPAKPRPALKESPSTTSLIGDLACALAPSTPVIKATINTAICMNNP